MLGDVTRQKVSCYFIGHLAAGSVIVRETGTVRRGNTHCGQTGLHQMAGNDGMHGPRRDYHFFDIRNLSYAIERTCCCVRNTLCRTTTSETPSYTNSGQRQAELMYSSSTHKCDMSILCLCLLARGRRVSWL